MTTPSEHEQPSPSGRTEDLRTRLRPRALDGMTAVGASERFALERIQALEVQITSAHERERSLTELAVRDGNKIADLEAAVVDLTDLAARAEASERSLFEAEGRAENAVRRAELMEGELMSTRAEVDRMRTRVIELESSLRRALAEVGAATTARAPDDSAAERAARMEASAQRSAELADRLRLKVVDLESSLRAVVTDMNEATAAQLRAEEAETALAAAGEAQIERPAGRRGRGPAGRARGAPRGARHPDRGPEHDAAPEAGRHARRPTGGRGRRGRRRSTSTSSLRTRPSRNCPSAAVGRGPDRAARLAVVRLAST